MASEGGDVRQAGPEALTDRADASGRSAARWRRKRRVQGRRGGAVIGVF